MQHVSSSPSKLAQPTQQARLEALLDNYGTTLLVDFEMVAGVLHYFFYFAFLSRVQGGYAGGARVRRRWTIRFGVFLMINNYISKCITTTLFNIISKLILKINWLIQKNFVEERGPRFLGGEND